MSKFFKSRNEARKNIPDDGAKLKQHLEQEIAKEMAVMTVAIPFLPSDQVRGIVLEKLGLQNGKSKNTLVRKGGGRIDYKKISLECPESLNTRRSTNKGSPRNIRKKLLGRSQPFIIVGYPAAGRNAGNQENEAANDTFGFSQASPTDQAPRPYERRTQAKPRKTLKRKLLTLTDDEDDWRLGGIENITTVESRPAKPRRGNIITSTPKKTTAEKPQQVRRDQAVEVLPMMQDPLSERSRSVRRDSVEQTAEADGFTHDSSEEDSVDQSNPRSRRGDTSTPEKLAVESTSGESLTEDSSSPVLNVKIGKGLKSRCGTIARATPSTITKPNEVLNNIFPTPAKRTLACDRLSQSTKSTADKQTQRYVTLSGASPNVSPVPMIGVTLAQHQSSNIQEILESPEGIFMDTAVTPAVPSDAASTSVVPPTENNTCGYLVAESPSQETTSRINSVSDDSGRLPGGFLSGKEYYSSSQKSPSVAVPREMSSANLTKCSSKSASQTLWCKSAASKHDSPQETSTISSSFRRLLLQEKTDSTVSSGISTMSSVNNTEHRYGTPESARAVTKKGQFPLRFNSSTSKSDFSWAGLGRTSAGKQNHTYSTPESERAVAPRVGSSSSSKNTTPESASQEPLPLHRKQGSYAGQIAHYSPVRGSSAEILSWSHGSNTQGKNSVAAGSDMPSAGSSLEKDDNYYSSTSVKSVNQRKSSSSGSTSATPQSASQLQKQEHGCYTENAEYFSTQHLNETPSGNNSFYSSHHTDDTPTSVRPSYGLFRKGIPRINQVSDQKMTARRMMMFRDEDLANSLESAQEKVPEEPAESQVLFTSPDDALMDISDDEMNHSKHFLVSNSQKQISVDSLLLKKGADRLDGLPFPSGEAVRPFTAEWLHQKKLGLLSDSTPTKTVTRPRTNSRNRNSWRSLESLLVQKRTNSQKAPPSQTSTPLLLEDAHVSMGATLPLTSSEEKSSLKAATWWKENSVLHALSQLGLENISNIDNWQESFIEQMSPSTKSNVMDSSPEDNVQDCGAQDFSPENRLLD